MNVYAMCCLLMIVDAIVWLFVYPIMSIGWVALGVIALKLKSWSDG